MRRLFLIGFLALAVSAAVAAFFAYGRNSRRTSAEAARVVTPEQRVIRTIVNATGTVRLRIGSEVRIGSQISGIVSKLNVTVGSRVRGGDVIAKIDDRTIRARIADAQAQADLDRASAEHAQADYDRAQKLSAEGLIPAQQEQDLRLTLAEAQARYRKSLRDFDLASVDLGYTEIRAPIGGTIASVSTQEGETVAASFSTPTFVTIIADHALQLVAMVDETDIANVRAGDPVTFTVDAYPSTDFPGAVLQIAPKATIVSGVVNYEVTIDIRKDANLLKPDMTANVSIQTAQHKALLLPSSAIQRNGTESFVYLAGKNGPERRSILLGSKEGGMVEVKKGVAATDAVLIVPQETDRKNRN